METKKSKVKSAIFKKSGNGTNGLYYIFDIEFENADKGQYFANKEQQDAFKIGVETEYTIEQKINGQYTNYSIKPVKAFGAKPMGNPVFEHKRVALKCATDLVCAGKVDEKKLIEAAEKLLKFLNA